MIDYSNYKSSVEERLIRYAKIDTQSDASSTTYPSTTKQKDLGRLMVEELKALGLIDAEMDEHGVVYATLESNSDKDIPVLCFCSHMDTSPDSSGTNVKPIIHHNYQGGPLNLPDSDVVIRPENHPELPKKIGHDIITASGTTLLGADNKAGLAAIMDAVAYLQTNPEVEHGTIKILFTCDEEIGRGTDKVDLKKLGADIAYTIDGEAAGSLENETFSADGAIVTFHGVAAHAGFAKGKMINAIKLASNFVDRLPKDKLSPETTEGKEGFVHPSKIQGGMEKASVSFILRDFETEKLADLRAMLEKLASDTVAAFPKASFKVDIQKQYRNMRDTLKQNPEIIEIAFEAIKRTGLTPKLRSIRGGTDGSKLSEMGLPCPNIFAGEHAFHSKEEWATVQDMTKSSETIVHICSLFAQKGK